MTVDPRSLSETQLAIDRARASSPETPSAVWEALQTLARQISTVRHDLVNLDTAVRIRGLQLYGVEGHGGDIPELRDDVREVQKTQRRIIRQNWALVGLAVSILGSLVTDIITHVGAH